MIRLLKTPAPGFLFVAFCLLLVAGCDDDNPVESEDVRLAEVQSDVFNPSCAVSGCHAGDNSPADLDLSEGVAYDNIVNVASTEVPSLMLVEPGNAEDSYLFIKITGDDRIALGTFQMPIGGELTEEQIDLVEEWIEAGAQR